MGTLYAARPGQSPGVARKIICIYIYLKRFNILRDMIYFNTYTDISRIQYIDITYIEIIYIYIYLCRDRTYIET